jgi:exosome complex RNA-binding protein Rrp42 (RNase PH superfamily)
LERVTPFVKVYYHDVEKEAMRQMILNDKIRLDGRDPQTIRPIWSKLIICRAHTVLPSLQEGDSVINSSNTWIRKGCQYGGQRNYTI